MKMPTRLLCLLAPIVLTACSAVGYHGGLLTSKGGFVFERKIELLADGRDALITVWAQDFSEASVEAALRDEARKYSEERNCPQYQIERLVFGVSNTWVDSRRYARATVRCPRSVLPEPLIAPSMGGVPPLGNVVAPNTPYRAPAKRKPIKKRVCPPCVPKK